ncbi:MAG: hypothetical protein GYA61_02610 [Spirochaetales bacterium]|nr:hypothetical protein [Spirochaetales bacterium]
MNKYSEIVENFGPFFVKVLSELAKERNLSSDRFEKLKKSDALKVVVLAPFLAQAEYAEMFAYANLSILLTAANFPQIFNPTKDISLETRATMVLQNIKPFAKDKKALKICEKALIAISYKDHLHDIDKDKKESKFNPLFEEKNKIKYEKLFNSIFAELEKYKTLSKHLDMSNLKGNNPGFWMS